MDNPGLAHVVFFWMKSTVTEDQKKTFEGGLEKLGTSPTIQKYQWGKPAPSDREVVDDSFDYSWIVYFANREDEKAYQDEPIHHEFVEKYSDLWEKVIVYDSFLG